MGDNFEEVDPIEGIKSPVNTRSKVEISDPLQGRETRVRKSTRRTTPELLAPTPGLRNRNSTCYGICVLHMLVYLMQLNKSLEKNYILKKLIHLRLEETDQIEDSTSLSITNDIIALMVKRLDPQSVTFDRSKKVRKGLKTYQQSSQEFLMFLIAEDCEKQQQGRGPSHMPLRCMTFSGLKSHVVDNIHVYVSKLKSKMNLARVR